MIARFVVEERKLLVAEEATTLGASISIVFKGDITL